MKVEINNKHIQAMKEAYGGNCPNWCIKGIIEDLIYWDCNKRFVLNIGLGNVKKLEKLLDELNPLEKEVS